MKIAFLSRYQKVRDRGAETVVKELMNRLSPHEVVVLSGSDADSFKKIINGKFDLVIPMNGRAQALKTSIGRFPAGYKMMITGQTGFGRDEIFNIAITRPDIFVALTNFMEDWAKKWAWGSKVVKIHNGADLKRFSPTGSKLSLNLPSPIILSVGALEWYKGHDKTIEAVSLLDQASLLIVGDGSQKEQLKNLAQKKLAGRFEIIKLPYEEIAKAYRSCDLFTLPSWDREAFGIVYVEAMASGLGVVAPNDSPRREIIGSAGILTDVNDPKKLSQALASALTLKWSDKATSQASKFSWDQIAKEYLECIESLFGKKTG